MQYMSISIIKCYVSQIQGILIYQLSLDSNIQLYRNSNFFSFGLSFLSSLTHSLPFKPITILMKLASCFIYSAIVLVLNPAAAKETDSPHQLLRIPIKRKENIAVSAHKHKLGKRANNDISLYNANGKEYLIEIGIGSPPQFFNVTLDTGRY